MKKKLLIALSVLVAVLVLAAVLAALVISGPRSYPYTVAEAEADSLLAAAVVDMISDAIVDDEGNIPEIAKIVIPAENVNALLRIAAYRLNREMKDDGIECAIGWENTSVEAAAILPLPLSKTVLLRGSVSPAIADGVLTLHDIALHAGRLPVPNWGIIREKITAKDIKDAKLKLAFEAVHDLSAAPDGSLKLGIYPAKISNLTRILITEED